MRVDAHVHFWKYDPATLAWITDNMKVLQQDYLPHAIAGTLQRNGIDACVAVQVDQRELETHYLVELSKTHDFIKGVVGWINLQGDDIEERLAYFSQYSIIKGWRHIAQAESPEFFYGEKFRRGLSAISAYNHTYDILVYHHQLKAAIDLVHAFPDQPFILDHCAKPDIAHRHIDEWAADIRAIAKHPHVRCKLSGLFTEAKWKSWSPADFYPYLDVVFEAFGTDRLLFGSDWPVMLLSGIYVQWKSLLEKYMENFEAEERDRVFGQNAVDFYHLVN